MNRLLTVLAVLGLSYSPVAAEEIDRPWIQLRGPEHSPLRNGPLRPWENFRLEASVHYGGDLRTSVEYGETVEFVVYERRRDQLFRLRRTEVALVPSKPGGHWAWCEIDPPVGGWPVGGIIVEARLRGMRHVRDRRTVRFEPLDELGRQLLQTFENDRTEAIPPESGIKIVTDNDATARVPAGATFLVEGTVAADPTSQSRDRPVEVVILSSRGPGVQTEARKRENLFLRANAFPVLWPAAGDKSWYQSQFRAPDEPGEYRLRVELKSAKGGTSINGDVRLTVTKPARQ